jgi:broad specificity phosphatase PhoE
MHHEIWFLTHAEVVQDPAVPVPDWRLSDLGRGRHAAFNARLEKAGVTALYCSAERKARDAAAIHGAALGLDPQVRVALGENDRSATGYLPPPDFEAMADAFFTRPDESIRGWERATDAQARILAAVRAADAEAPEGTLLIVAHGAVGALLRAHAEGAPISRRFDQTGGGNLARFARGPLSPLSGWERIGAP